MLLRFWLLGKQPVFALTDMFRWGFKQCFRIWSSGFAFGVQLLFAQQPISLRLHGGLVIVDFQDCKISRFSSARLSSGFLDFGIDSQVSIDVQSVF